MSVTTTDIHNIIKEKESRYDNDLAYIFLSGRPFLSKRKQYKGRYETLQLSHDFIDMKNFHDSKILSDIKQDPYNFDVKTFAMLSNEPINEGGFSQLFRVEKLAIVYSEMGQDKIIFADPDSPWLVKRISTRVAQTEEVIREHEGFMQSEPGIQALSPIKIKHPSRYYRNSRGRRTTAHYNYYPMHAIQGVSLTTLIKQLNKEGRSFVERMRLIQSILEAYQQHIIEKGLIHLDMKPDNILIGQDGKVTIIDFGTHRQATDEPAVIEMQGSLPYCDQEGYQAPVSHTIDIYSLGLIMGEILGATNPETYVMDILREIQAVSAELLQNKSESTVLDAAINQLLTQSSCLHGLTESVKEAIKAVIQETCQRNDITVIDKNTDLQLLLYRCYDFPKLLSSCTGLAASEKEGLRTNLIELLSSMRGELSTRKTFTELLQATITLTQVSRCTSSSSSSSSSSCISTGRTSSLFPGAPYDSSDDDVYLPSSSEPGTPFGLSSPMPSLSDLSMSPPGLRSTHSSPSSPCSLSSSDFPSGSSPDTGSSVPLDNEDKVTRRAIEAFMSNGF